LKKTIIFISVPLLIIVSIDFWLRNQNSTYKEKVNGLEEEKDSIQLVILGDSHAAYGIDPTQFSLNSYNLANLGQSLYFDKRITLKHIDELKKLQYVLINFDYPSFYYSSQGDFDTWSYYGNGIKYKNKQYWLANISPFLFGYTKDVTKSIAKKRVANLWKYKDADIIDHIDVEYYRINPKDKFTKGFLGVKGPIDSTFNETWCKRRAKYFNNTIFPSTERKEVLYDLEDFIKKLKQRNVTPVLITPPMFYEYYAYLDTAVLRQNEEDIGMLCKLYNIEYWDFSNDPRFAYSKEDYSDPDHLNKKGAKRFTRLLDEKIDSINKRPIEQTTGQRIVGENIGHLSPKAFTSREPFPAKIRQ